MKMKTVMEHQFSEVPKATIERSSFDRSHGVKTTFDAGYLVPIMVEETLPGDTFNVNMTAFARMATPIFPIMDNVYMDTHFFAVPVRLIWDNWKKFNGEQVDPGDSIDYTVPTMTAPGAGYSNQTLHDYFGIPTLVGNLEHNSLWHRAYNLIYNEWFRDQNLQDSVIVDKGDGPDTYTNYTLLKRGKRHDYFTSCLPWPQKGDAVNLPLGTTAQIATDVTTGTDLGVYSTQYSQFYKLGFGAGTKLEIDGTGAVEADRLYADLSTATSATINQLREAFQIQKLLERDARGGTRYTEIVKSHFGVTSPDARLQRPEYLGGGSTPVNVTPIEQTSSTDATSPQGNLAAMATASITNHGFTKSFTEHCVILGLVSVRADLTYQQGLNRCFSRQTRYDFYWPALSHIGEQAVLNKEIYADGSAADENVFGYQERYAEYRYKPSMITGKFRSNDAQSLDAWHLSQEFSSLPGLNSTFIEENPPLDRVIAVPSEPHFIFDSYISMKCARPMPVYSVPGKIDHF
jgi:hypothetical protein